MKTVRRRVITFVLVSAVMALLASGLSPLSPRLLNTTPATDVSLDAGPATGVWGTRFTIDAAAHCGGSPVPGATITIRRLTHNDPTWIVVASGSASAAGLFRVVDRPPGSSSYIAETTGGGGCGPGSASALVGVRPGIIVNPGQSFAGTGRAVSLRGRVDPPRPGHLVTLQVFNGRFGFWETIQSMRLSGNSTFHFRYGKTAPGYLIFRVGYPSQRGSDMWNISRAVRADWLFAPQPSGSSSGPSNSGSTRRCHPAYRGACLDPSIYDYDCFGGNDNGPGFTDRVYLTGTTDPYDLDRNDDGIGCNSRPETGRTYP